MGYNLMIGEGCLQSYAEDGLEAQCRIVAEAVHLDNAPAFGEPTDHTNSRWPSYSAWHEFCEKADILDAMYYQDSHGNDTGDIRGGHPGAFPINKEFKEVIDYAYNRIRMQAKTLDPDADIFSNDIGSLWARIQWLKFWTDWALDNCKNPVFTNS